MLAPLRHRLVPQLPKPKIRFAVGLESEALQAWVTILEEESHTYRQAANEARTAAREALQLTSEVLRAPSLLVTCDPSLPFCRGY